MPQNNGPLSPNIDLKSPQCRKCYLAALQFAVGMIRGDIQTRESGIHLQGRDAAAIPALLFVVEDIESAIAELEQGDLIQ